jgi:hypothetical protein
MNWILRLTFVKRFYRDFLCPNQVTVTDWGTWMGLLHYRTRFNRLWFYRFLLFVALKSRGKKRALCIFRFLFLNKVWGAVFIFKFQVRLLIQPRSLLFSPFLIIFLPLLYEFLYKIVAWLILSVLIQLLSKSCCPFCAKLSWV